MPYLGMRMLDVNTIDQVDLTVDGADVVDYQLNGIKGGGAELYGKLFRR